MTDLSSIAGTWVIDPSHSRLGFETRHAVITKVRGHFADFEGTIVVGANTASSSAKVTAKLDSIDTGSADRDGHLKSADFFDTENTNELVFESTAIKATGDTFVVTGNLTIKGVTNSIDIAVEPTGTATDPFGNARFGFEGESEINRKDFGLTWNAALETGGILVSENIKLEFEISTIQAK
jgi:polyisoprenoid-binding protein YceI